MNDKKKKDDRSIIIFAAFFFIVANSVIFLFLFGNSAEDYLGSWKNSRGEVIHIQKADVEPSETIKLACGKVAKLLLPIELREGARRHRFALITDGGIYEVGGRHAIIVYCILHKTNVLLGIRKSGSNIELGYVKGFPDLIDALQGHHTHSKFVYDIKKWETFRPL